MFTIEYVKNLKWDDAEHTSFSCIAKYEEFNYEMPTGASPTDPYVHIQEIWLKGNAGDYGVIEEFVPHPIPDPGPSLIRVPLSAEGKKLKARSLLSETDWAATEAIADPAISNPYLTNQAEFLAYRGALREIEVNPPEGFATWPVKPTEVWSS